MVQIKKMLYILEGLTAARAVGSYFQHCSVCDSVVTTSLASFLVVPLAMKWGTLAVAFSAFALLVAAGSMLTFLSYSFRYPIDMTLVILAIGLGWFSWTWTDNHGVRVLGAEQLAMKPSDRPTLENAFENWRTAVGSGTHEQTPPFVIVATTGGGLRAAFWTSVVLGAIEEKVPEFHKHVFAISGVSGGSFGAALFDTLLKVESREVWDISECENKATLQGRARCILAQDYLAPAVSGLLYPDLLQRFIPLPRPLPRFPDRAMSTEQGWEQGWRNKGVLVDSESAFARPFLGLWSDCLPQAGCWRPALLLNGTHVETGKRIITSNLKINKKADKKANEETDTETFTDADDIYKLIGDKEDFRISTAVNNSARFPYVAPAGTLRKDGKDTAHVDGGYFENFGAGTAAELLRAAHDYFKDGFRPIVIQISSDPDLTEDRLPVCDEGRGGDPPPQAKSTTEYGAPLDAFFATRGARGIFAVKQLCRLMGATTGEQAKFFFHFRMCNSEGHTDPGLGWTISERSFGRISGYIEKCGNDEQLDDLVNLLTSTKTARLVSAQGEQQEQRQ